MKLVAYTSSPDVDKQIENYYLPENQVIYCGFPKDAIEEAQKDPNRYPILMMDDEQLITFLILHEKDGVKPYSDNPQAILLRGFSTNHAFQGKGYSKQTLHLLPEYIRKHFPTINEIVLAVNEANQPAIQLYLACGYLDTQKRIKREYGSLVIMSQII